MARQFLRISHPCNRRAGQRVQFKIVKLRPRHLLEEALHLIHREGDAFLSSDVHHPLKRRFRVLAEEGIRLGLNLSGTEARSFDVVEGCHQLTAIPGTTSPTSDSHRIQLDVVEFTVLIHLLEGRTNLINVSVTPCSDANSTIR